MDKTIKEGSLLWTPSEQIIEDTNITKFIRWLADNYNLQFADYDALWKWSVDDIPAFWKYLSNYCEIKFTKQADSILANKTMPGTQCFVGSELNYTENIFQKMTDEHPMMFYKAEDKSLQEISWQEVSPRHVPNEIFQITDVPYTLSGKKMEVPIRKILLGRDITKAINTGAMRNPDSIQYFVDFAKTLNQDN